MKGRLFITNILLVSCFVSFSCTTHYSPATEQALRMAGRNRSELEKVLTYYGKNHADSLKFRAAEFLIANMPGKYSEYYDAPWNDVATVHLRWTSSSDKQQVLDTYRLGKPIVRNDIEFITADYLINNIDLAFKVWQEVPWGSRISFDVFCEEILPYRVGGEPLENWREKVLSSFADIYKSFVNDTTAMTSVEACGKVNDLLPRFRMDKDFPWMSYSQLMTSTRGTCDAMTALTVFVMRGLGIPVTVDYTPKWVESPIGHTWSSVTDSESGTHISFMGTESNPGQAHQGTTLNKPKAYRKLYANQYNLIADSEDRPPLLRNINNMIDITSETEYCIDVWIHNEGLHDPEGNVFLATLLNMEWFPVGWGENTPHDFKFKSVKSGLYLPVYYRDGIVSPAGKPFSVGYNSYHFYSPYSSNTKSFKSIAPMDYISWLHQMEGGKFEVANRSDFADARTLCTITRSGLGYNSISVVSPSSYRYVRYITHDGTPYNISELEFYDMNNEKIQGITLEEPGDEVLQDREKIFDGDVNTFFTATADFFSGIGLDFGEPRQISKIRYLPRTDGNGIYEGHEYELLYWDGEQWKSLGKEVATSHILKYEAPDNVLFYLKNLTLNKIHTRPFIIELGMQKWI